jgi:hypothetical protein
MVIVAASKGRQIAYEDAKWGGGVFTYALEKALLNRASDSKTGESRPIDVSELYSGLKALVAQETEGDPRGVQTPWLEPKNMPGDFGLF